MSNDALRISDFVQPTKKYNIYYRVINDQRAHYRTD